MNNVKGEVTKVTKGKGTVKTQHGTFDKLNVTIQDEDKKETTVQKLVMMGRDGQELVGKKVDVTYTEKEVELPDGSTFTTRNATSKNFVVLDQNGQAPTSQASGTTNSGYNTEGARIGMIAGRGLELAVARKTLTVSGIREAMQDIKNLVEELENFTKSINSTSSNPFKHATNAVSDDEPPFNI